MATEQIPTTLIADDAVTNAKIGADAVSTTEIANDIDNRIIKFMNNSINKKQDISCDYA